MEPEDDPLPALIAALDQMLANAPQFARLAYGLYVEFEKAGFTASEALYLTACQLHSDPGSPA